MRTYLAIAAFALVLIPCVARAADRPAESPAAALFEQAMKADASEREKLLREAVKLDPDYELAHWHLGHVFFQGMWRSIESIGQLVSHDPRWRDYRERLAEIDDSPAQHAALARWCRKRRLENEAKWHWFQVLRSDPDNREALGNLGLKRYAGGLYTDEQIAELQAHREQAEKDFKRYRRQLKRLVNSAERADEAERDKALAELAAVTDPAAVAALMKTLVKASADAKNSEFAERVCHSVVTALSGIDEHASTLKLLEIALYAPQEAVRHSAAATLRYREPTDFVPLLMASLEAPIESTFSIEVMPSGHVTLVENFYEEGPTAVKSRVQSSNFLTRHTVRSYERRRIDSSTGNPLPQRSDTRVFTNPVKDYGKALARASSAASSIAKENEARRDRNSRVSEVLEIAIDQKLGNDPKAWWTAWQEYNDLYTPEELPVEESYHEVRDHQITYTEYRPASCFVAGTPVWTQSGMKQIEQIGVGELVLSQDPLTGRVAYRPVVDTTIRPPTGVVELTVDGEKIVTTRGHRFWVTGEGWKMAKFLNPGSVLFGTDGPRVLAEVSEAENEAAYNLVVGDYHTYFVGESRLLVHDNNCPLPTTAAVPGAARP